jgi:hypothetical protein
VIAGVLRTADRTGCCRVFLAERQNLSFPWRYVREIQFAGVALPAMFVVFLILGIWITPRRRQLALILAGATAVTGLVTLGLLWAGPFWSGLVSRPGPGGAVVRAADTTVFGSATSGLRAHSLLVATIGASALVALAISRRTRSPLAEAVDQPTIPFGGPPG